MNNQKTEILFFVIFGKKTRPIAPVLVHVTYTLKHLIPQDNAMTPSVSVLLQSPCPGLPTVRRYSTFPYCLCLFYRVAAPFIKSSTDKFKLNESFAVQNGYLLKIAHFNQKRNIKSICLIISSLFQFIYNSTIFQNSFMRYESFWAFLCVFS